MAGSGICVLCLADTCTSEVHPVFNPVAPYGAPNDTAYKRWSCHSGLKLLCKLCRTSPPPAMVARFTVFWACRPCGPAGWLALLLTKAGDVETNPCPTTLNKKVWNYDICHKQTLKSTRLSKIRRRIHPINDSEKDLTMKERATLAQLRFVYCKLLGSYKSRIKKDV